MHNDKNSSSYLNHYVFLYIFNYFSTLSLTWYEIITYLWPAYEDTSVYRVEEYKQWALCQTGTETEITTKHVTDMKLFSNYRIDTGQIFSSGK
jgi:hypothetical protein